MKLLAGQGAFVADWVAERIAYVENGAAFGPCNAIAVLSEDGKILGGVVYHDYHPGRRGIELSFASASKRWLTQPIISALLRYPFEELDCIRCTGCTPRRATSARRFLDHFGFKREGVVRWGFGDDHMIISGLLRSEWEKSRWAKPLSERARPLEAQHGEKGQLGPGPGPGGAGAGAV